MAAFMIGSWAAFVATGRPGPSWPRFRTTAEVPYVRTLAPTGGGQSTDLAAGHHCDLWTDLATS
ncbi:hypothetical protein [Actinoplanes sp. NPDC049118]|uniref:hypothetical protein n=1 Tax=Actinoplanes sp. NPDC049118 TaxID=3155769 RepID=UPI0033C1AC4F